MKSDLFPTFPFIGQLAILLSSLILSGNCQKDEKVALEFFIKGKAFYENQELKKASIEFNNSIEEDKNFLPAYLMLGKAYFYQGDFENSEKIFKKAQEKFPGNSVCHFWLGRIYLLDKARIPLAKEAFQSVIEEDENHFEAYYYLAKVFEKEENFKESLIAYNRAKMIKRSFDKIHRDLSLLYEKVGFDDKAKAEYNEISDEGLEEFNEVKNGKVKKISKK